MQGIEMTRLKRRVMDNGGGGLTVGHVFLRLGGFLKDASITRRLQFYLAQLYLFISCRSELIIVFGIASRWLVTLTVVFRGRIVSAGGSTHRSVELQRRLCMRGTNRPSSLLCQLNDRRTGAGDVKVLGCRTLSMAMMLFLPS